MLLCILLASYILLGNQCINYFQFGNRYPGFKLNFFDAESEGFIPDGNHLASIHTESQKQCAIIKCEVFHFNVHFL